MPDRILLELDNAGDFEDRQIEQVMRLFCKAVRLKPLPKKEDGTIVSHWQVCAKFTPGVWLNLCERLDPDEYAFWGEDGYAILELQFVEALWIALDQAMPLPKPKKSRKKPQPEAVAGAA